MSASQWKVVVNREEDLSPSQEPIRFLRFLLLEADLLLSLSRSSLQPLLFLYNSLPTSHLFFDPK